MVLLIEREYDENSDAKVDHNNHEGEDVGYDHEWGGGSNIEKPRGDAKPSTNSFSIESGSFIGGAAAVLGAGTAGLAFTCFVDEGFLGFNKFR